MTELRVTIPYYREWKDITELDLYVTSICDQGELINTNSLHGLRNYVFNFMDTNEVEKARVIIAQIFPLSLVIEI